MSKAEKFIQDCTRNCSQLHYNSACTLRHCITPDQARKAVEIAREEMKEKACEYLDGIIEILNDRGHQLKKERIIGGFKQAMKDE